MFWGLRRPVADWLMTGSADWIRFHFSSHALRLGGDSNETAVGFSLTNATNVFFTGPVGMRRFYDHLCCMYAQGCESINEWMWTLTLCYGCQHTVCLRTCFCMHLLLVAQVTALPHFRPACYSKPKRWRGGHYYYFSFDLRSIEKWGTPYCRHSMTSKNDGNDHVTCIVVPQQKISVIKKLAN